MALSSRRRDLIYADLEGLKTWIGNSWVAREARRRLGDKAENLEVLRLVDEIEERINNIQEELMKEAG